MCLLFACLVILLFLSSADVFIFFYKQCPDQVNILSLLFISVLFLFYLLSFLILITDFSILILFRIL